MELKQNEEKGLDNGLTEKAEDLVQQVRHIL